MTKETETWMEESPPFDPSVKVDPAHLVMDIYDPRHGQDISQEIWKAKYAWGNEEHPHETFERVARGVFDHHKSPLDPDTRQIRVKEASWAMKNLLFVPGGRIIAGLGTEKVVTGMNCFVCRTIPDSMDGIADALKDAMLTMQQGGGIGMDFSTLRPSGAHLQRTAAVASGPLPFMDMWDSMCASIMSAGARRGAMMATLNCEHPDLLDFITAKRQAGRLTQFNVSVLVTDAFMAAVEEDANWDLGFGVPKHDKSHLYKIHRDDDYYQGEWYGYSRHKARDIWNMIIEKHLRLRRTRCDLHRSCEPPQQSSVTWRTFSVANPCGESSLCRRTVVVT